MSDYRPNSYDGYQWKPPRPGEVKIKYSTISEKHQRYLESRKKNKGRRRK